MLYSAFLIVLGCAAGAMLFGWTYFRHYQLPRPPIGIFTLGDIAVMIGIIILVPYLYLVLPSWLLIGLFALMLLSVLQLTAEPVLRVRWAPWLVALMLVGADIGTNFAVGATSASFLAVNNIVLVVAIIGATNLWAQSGMKARDITVLAGALAVYDLIATSLSSLMLDSITRLQSLPFAPLVAWGGAGPDGLRIGLGDLLLATVFPLVMRKAFGRSAGIAAITISLSTIVTMITLIVLARVNVPVPVMTVLGPLMVLQYGYWIRRQGQERTTWQYLQAEPVNE